MTLGELIVKMGVDMREFDAGMSKSENTITNFGAKLGKTGKALSLGVTAPIMAFGALALRASADFQTSMNRVGALSGATGDSLMALRDQAKELGATTAFSASQAADAMGFLAMAGFEAEQILGAMPSTLQLAAAAQIDLASAADITSNILTGYSMSVDQLGHANDVLVRTFTRTNTDLQQLGHAMKYVGPIASGLGVQFEETAAIIGMFGNAGIQGSSAGTALRTSLARLAKPTKEVTDTLNKLGINVRDTSTGALLPMVEIIELLEKSGAGAEEMLALFSVRGGPAMQALLEQGSGALRALTKDLENAGGTAERIAKAQMAGFNGAVLEMKSAFEGAQLALMEGGLLDGLTGLVRWITRGLQAMSKMNSETANSIIAIAGVTAVIGPLMIALAALIKLFAGVALVLGTTLLPLIVVGGAVVVGLAAVAAAIVKTKLDARAAKTELDRYTASLNEMSRSNLLTQRNLMATQLEVGLERNTLREPQIARLRGEIFKLDRMIAKLPPTLAATGETAEETETALGGLGETSDDLASRLQGLKSVLLDFKNLQKFRLFTMDEALPEISQAISRVGSLRMVIQGVEEDVKKLGSLAPTGTLTFLEAMRSQLRAAEESLDELAEKFTKMWEKVDNFKAGIVGGGPPIIEIRTLTLSPPEFSRAYMVQLTLWKARLAVASAATQFFGNAIEQGRSQFRNAIFGAQQFVAQLTPMGLAARLVSQVFENLGPALEVLLMPVDILARALSAILLPTLRLMFPVIKGVAIAFTYLWEVTARVAQGLSFIIGHAVKAIGQLIDKLPFVSGKPIIRAGEALLGFSNGMGDAVEALKGARDEIRSLEFDSALAKTTDGLNQLNEAVIGAVSGFKYAALRHDAITPNSISPAMASTSRSGSGGGTVVTGNTFSPVINISGEEGSGRSPYRQMYEEFDRLSLGDRAAREMFHLFPEPR